MTRLTSSRTVLVLALVATAASATVVSACSGDDDSGRSSSGVVVPQDAGPEGGEDADAGPPRPDLCNNLLLEGQVIQEIALRGEAPPALGGAVNPGVYDLSELNVYGVFPDGGTDVGDGGEVPVDPLTGKAARATLVVTTTHMRFIEARGTPEALGPEAVRAFSYRTSETSIAATQVCPVAAPAKTIPYSFVGSGLALFPDPNHRELYIRR